MTKPTPLRPASGRTFLLIVIALAAIAGGIAVSSKLLERTQDLRTAQVYPEARSLPEFELRTAGGKALTRQDLHGHWSLLFFGFTNCPDTCPDTMAVLDSVVDDLETMGAASAPQVVFISVDPERDDAEALGEYVRWFDEDFIGATGSQEAIESLTKGLGVFYALDEPDPNSGFYTVNHSAAVLIVNPQGQLYGRFTPPLDRQAIAADLFALTR